METKTQNLKKVFSVENIGRGKFKLEIYLDVDRELTDNDNWAISECGEKLTRIINQETYRTNKTYIEKAKEDKQDLINLFGNKQIFVQEIPNQYNVDHCHNPWLMVTTNVGHIKIGRRRHVFEIDWSGTIIPTKAKDLFPDEDVTREDRYIHAYGLEKAQEYINKILSSSGE